MELPRVSTWLRAVARGTACIRCALGLDAVCTRAALPRSALLWLSWSARSTSARRLLVPHRCRVLALRIGRSRNRCGRCHPLLPLAASDAGGRGARVPQTPPERERTTAAQERLWAPDRQRLHGPRWPR